MMQRLSPRQIVLDFLAQAWINNEEYFSTDRDFIKYAELRGYYGNPDRILEVARNPGIFQDNEVTEEFQKVYDKTLKNAERIKTRIALNEGSPMPYASEL